MNADRVNAAIKAGAVILDLRPPHIFATGHLPGAINLQFNRADLADRATMALPATLECIIHAEPEPVARVAATILDEAGFSVSGYLEGGLQAWRTEGLTVETMPVIDVTTLRDNLDRYCVLDAREPFEYRHGHVPGAASLPWAESWRRYGEMSPKAPLAVYCGTQVRSSLTASVLRRHGRDATVVVGGMSDWLERGYAVDAHP
ncbi:MAG TPA: rhodanese-like domain-containing protein [Candidatus Dormibacteraeota bacterium]|nr:rhodanese-like domain-containing protein [Candidatus Dormibacteraeota bacterium]